MYYFTYDAITANRSIIFYLFFIFLIVRLML